MAACFMQNTAKTPKAQLSGFPLFVIIKTAVGTFRVVKIVGLTALGAFLLGKVFVRIAGQFALRQLGPVELYLAAIRTGVDFQFQSPRQQVRQITEK